MKATPLERLTELGQSVWLDDLSRELLAGPLADLIERDVVRGVTSNPTIFAKAIGAGELYDAQVRQLAEAGHDLKETFVGLAVADVAAACDLLRPHWDGGHGQSGYVSLEVDPRLAFDADATIAEAERLHGLVDRPNLYVKIPATDAGLVAIEEMIARGRSINVTLIFALGRYAEVAHAYLRGIERLVAQGGDPSAVASVASFFVSRVDTEADRRLQEVGGPDDLLGRLAVANAKLAYRRYQEIFAGEAWERLVASGANAQRCLWASTSTKDPERPDTMYVEPLIGADTVSTMPSETIRAFQEHGRAAPTLAEGVEEARWVLESVERAGVDYNDVCATLEREGVDKFVASYEELIGVIGSKRAALAAA